MPLQQVSLAPIEQAIDNAVAAVYDLPDATTEEKNAAIAELEDLRERLHDICRPPLKAVTPLVRKFGSNE
jgi:hypothetical protein